MKNLFDDISRKIKITKNELSALIFVIFIFCFGWIAKEIKLDLSSNDERKFDYSYQDSLFKALNENTNFDLGHKKKTEKRVDSEVELYDFSNQKLVSKKKSITQPKVKSININTAGEETLSSIPGIGKIIASRIIKLRIQKNGFKNLDELIEVKRIGKKKLEKIKKYLIIEN